MLAELMSEHPNFAKNVLPNCGQGRATANKLWETLTVRLNTCGPPIKNAKAWRMVYTDQKFHVKKKVSFNKASKKKTGGGPYEELTLSSAEEQILQASGIQVSVEGLSSLETFGSAQNTTQAAISTDTEQYFNLCMDTSLESEGGTEGEEEKKTYKVHTKSKSSAKAATKLELITANMETLEEHQKSIDSKLNRLIEIKERTLKIKEEEHAANMNIKEIDLQMKSIQLEVLKKDAHYQYSL